MKAVAYTAVHIERIIEVKMAKTVAVFAERLAVRDVQCRYGSRESVSENGSW
jgi:hypothetical protein